MSRLILCVVISCVASTGVAHFPDRDNKIVRPQFPGLIGPLGNRLPPSYRRRYNRPTNIGGYLAYLAAPSSQEAMAWHKATHRGNYRNKMPRTEMQYFYPKPWEVLTVGPRAGTEATDKPSTEMQPAYDGDLPESVIDVLELQDSAE